MQLKQVTTTLPEPLYNKLVSRAKAEYSNKCVLARQAIAFFLENESGSVRSKKGSITKEAKVE